MAGGISSENISPVISSTEVLVNGPEGTGRQAVTAFASQVAAMEPFAGRLPEADAIPGLQSQIDEAGAVSAGLRTDLTSLTGNVGQQGQDIQALQSTALAATPSFSTTAAALSSSSVAIGGLFSVPVRANGIEYRVYRKDAGPVANLQYEVPMPSALAETAKKADGFKVVIGSNGHPQIVDRNGVELLGFDDTGKAILRISLRSLPDLLALLSAFLPGSDASLFPSLRGAGGIELLGFDKTGHARFAVSQDVADQVGRLLNLDLIYDPVASGLIASPDIIVFGDSMSSNPERPAGISSALGGRTVSTLAKGGHSALGIAVCAGAMPLTITVSGGVIPGDGSAVAVSSKNTNILSSGGTNAGTARVYFTNTGISASCLIETDSAGNWTIRREASGADIAVGAGTAAILHPTSGTATIPATSLYRGRTAVLPLGRNGTRNTRAARVANTLHPIRQLIRFLTPRVKNIVIIGPYNGRAKRASDGSDYEPAGSTGYAEMMTLIEEMQREFGRLFLDMRSSAVRNAPYDIGITLTADDQADMASDCIARQLFSDDIHMGAPMRSWEGSFIGNHLAALGF